ncbi:MAG TPA: DUF1579 domain-containing protein [Verrucomicrobiae bacterium]|jgi:hypothetical protein|nr:DUF1579 domain-containing protein [Verrucomicrobiae bacterium]
MKKVFSIALILSLFILPGLSFADNPPAQGGAALPPGVTAEDMARMTEMTTPNENHQKLNALVGKFKVKTSWQMAADAPVQTSEGEAEGKWILDGRFVEQHFKGDFMGKPFEGLSLTGYDNMKKEYSAVWLDSVATGMMKSTMKYDDATKSFSEEGKFSCPMTGETDKDYRAVTTIVDDNNYKYEMYQKGKDGKEFKAMQIDYTRA